MSVNNNKTIVNQPAPVGNQPQVSFSKSQIDQTVWDKGYDVVHEKYLQCPCKDDQGGHRSDCKNCGGSGIVWINAIHTRMVLDQMKVEKKYEEWSARSIGDINITASHSNQLSYLDKITVLNAEAIYTEVLHMHEDSNGDLFDYTMYDVIEPFYVGLYKGNDQKFQILTKGTDYTIEGDSNTFKLDSSFKGTQSNFSVTIRYKYRPVYYVMEITREAMTAKVEQGGIPGDAKLPVHALGRRPHDIKDAENLKKNRLLDNSDFSCEQLQDTYKKC